MFKQSFITFSLFLVPFCHITAREHASDRYIASSHTTDTNNQSLKNVLSMLSWLNYEQAYEKLQTALGENKSLLHTKIEKANEYKTISYYAYFSQMCELQKYIPYIELNIIYATVYKRAKTLTSQTKSLEKKDFFKLLPTPKQFERLLSTQARGNASYGENIKNFKVPRSVHTMVKEAVKKLTIEELFGLLLLGYMCNSPEISALYKGSNRADVYAILYKQVHALCKGTGSKEQNTLFAILSNPHVYAMQQESTPQP